MNKLYFIRLLPGYPKDIILKAKEPINESQMIIGLKPRINLIKDLVKDKEIYYTGESEISTSFLQV